MHTYIVTYDPLMSDPNPARLLEFVKTHAYTYQYYIHSWGAIFIKSSAELGSMVATYKNFLNPNTWTICEIQQPAFNSGGTAPIEFWNWLNAVVPPALESAS